MIRKVLLLVVALFVLTAIFTAWVGYGNPFEDVAFSGAGQDRNYEQAFFVSECQPDGQCQVAKEHTNVIHFHFSHQYKGSLKGRGENPILKLRNAGLKFLPHPDAEVAALKWCTTGQIWWSFAHGARIFVTELGDDPVDTVRCVQTYTSRSFDAYIGHPMGRTQNGEPFDVLKR